MSGTDPLRAMLRQAATEAEQVAALLAAAAARLDEANTLLAATVQGAGHPSALQAVARLRSATRHVVDGDTSVRRALAAVDQYAALL